jgi:GTP-binding protein
VDRTRLLVFLLDVIDEPEERYRVLLQELGRYGDRLLQLPRIVCLSKMDLWPAGEPLPELDVDDPLLLSSVTQRGVEELRHAIGKQLELAGPAPASPEDPLGDPSSAEDREPDERA